MKKTSQKFKIDEILKACALFALVLQLCTCVSCEYTRFQPITSAYFFFLGTLLRLLIHRQV